MRMQKRKMQDFNNVLLHKLHHYAFRLQEMLTIYLQTAQVFDAFSPIIKCVLNFDVEKRTKLFSKFQKTRINHQSAIRTNIDLFSISEFAFAMRLNRRNANYRHAFFLSPKYAPFLTALPMFSNCLMLLVVS